MCSVSTTTSLKLYAYQNFLPSKSTEFPFLKPGNPGSLMNLNQNSQEPRTPTNLGRKTCAEVNLMQAHEVSVSTLLVPPKNYAPSMAVTQGADIQWAHLKTKK